MPRSGALPLPMTPLTVLLPVAVSLLMAVINITAAFLDQDGVRAVTAWLYLPPLMACLVLTTGLRTARSRWWLAGLVLCWLGDGLGGQGFLLLLGCFLLGHLAYVVALAPTWRRSWARRPAGLVHVAVLTVGLVLVVPHTGSLAPAVVVYGLVLTLMALLATVDGWPVAAAGILGGLLFMVSDLSLGWERFAHDLPADWTALLVIGTYVPAQVGLLLTILRLERPYWPGEH